LPAGPSASLPPLSPRAGSAQLPACANDAQAAILLDLLLDALLAAAADGLPFVHVAAVGARVAALVGDTACCDAEPADAAAHLQATLARIVATCGQPLACMPRVVQLLRAYGQHYRLQRLVFGTAEQPTDATVVRHALVCCVHLPRCACLSGASWLRQLAVRPYLGGSSFIPPGGDLLPPRYHETVPHVSCVPSPSAGLLPQCVARPVSAHTTHSYPISGSS